MGAEGQDVGGQDVGGWGVPGERVPGDLSDSIEIAAAPQAVWALVADVRNLVRWSPQVESVRLRVGFDEVGLGAEFTNRNVDGDFAWVTHGRVVRFEPPRQLAFRIEENWVVWSFHLEPLTDPTNPTSPSAPAHPPRTRLTQRRAAPEGIAPLALGLADRFLGGQEAFTASIRAGMRQTLEGIKAAAEGR